MIGSLNLLSRLPRRLDLRLNIEQLTVTARREVLLNFCGMVATIFIADRKLQLGSFTILDWLESHFRCRKSESRFISSTPLTHTYTASVLLLVM